MPWARIGELVGHDDLVTTARTYTHVVADEREFDYEEALRWTRHGPYLLVGLAGGAVGSLLTTWARISYERAAEIRAHMLGAADEFSTSTLAALTTARNATGAVLRDSTPLLDEGGYWREDIQTAFDAANEAVDLVLAKEARVHLLFGDETPAGVADTAIGQHLRNLVATLEQRESLRAHGAGSEYSKYFARTQTDHKVFNRVALTALTETWWQRLRARLQRSKER
jgi:hypothetical protein